MAEGILSTKRFVTTVISLSIFLFIDPSSAADLASAQKALAIISDFAEKICQSPPIKGETQNIELTGQGKAELNAIVKKVVDLGIEGAAKYQSTKYQGLLHKDLANALKHSADCRLTVFRDLKDKLVPQVSSESPGSSPSKSPKLNLEKSPDKPTFVLVSKGEGEILNVETVSIKVLNLAVSEQKCGTVGQNFIVKSIGLNTPVTRPVSSRTTFLETTINFDELVAAERRFQNQIGEERCARMIIDVAIKAKYDDAQGNHHHRYFELSILDQLNYKISLIGPTEYDTYFVYSAHFTEKGTAYIQRGGLNISKAIGTDLSQRGSDYLELYMTEKSSIIDTYKVPIQLERWARY